MINFLRQLDEERYHLTEDKRILIERSLFEDIADYSTSVPTRPSPGRVYRRTYQGLDASYVFVCEAGKGTDHGFTMHVPYKAEIL